jgi:hypothetical protein
MSKAFSLDRQDIWPILKPAVYAIASIAIATMISFLSVGTVDPKFVPLIPVVNIILVALKKFFDDGVSESSP